MTPPLELRRNELKIRFLYKLKRNSSFMETLNTLDNREDQNYDYEQKESSTKLMGVYLRRLETRYMEDQKEK